MQIQQEDACEQRVNDGREVFLTTGGLELSKTPNRSASLSYYTQGGWGGHGSVWCLATLHVSTMHVCLSLVWKNQRHPDGKNETAFNPNVSVSLGELMLTSKVRD